MAKTNISAKLDWNRMLGFEQITEARESKKGLGAKVGQMVGQKVGQKVGVKLGTKRGLKG